MQNLLHICFIHETFTEGLPPVVINDQVNGLSPGDQWKQGQTGGSISYCLYLEEEAAA